MHGINFYSKLTLHLHICKNTVAISPKRCVVDNVISCCSICFRTIHQSCSQDH